MLIIFISKSQFCTILYPFGQTFNKYFKKIFKINLFMNYLNFFIFNNYFKCFLKSFKLSINIIIRFECGGHLNIVIQLWFHSWLINRFLERNSFLLNFSFGCSFRYLWESINFNKKSTLIDAILISNKVNITPQKITLIFCWNNCYQ